MALSYDIRRDTSPRCPFVQALSGRHMGRPLQICTNTAVGADLRVRPVQALTVGGICPYGVRGAPKRLPLVYKGSWRRRRLRGYLKMPLATWCFTSFWLNIMIY